MCTEGRLWENSTEENKGTQPSTPYLGSFFYVSAADTELGTGNNENIHKLAVMGPCSQGPKVVITG